MLVTGVGSYVGLTLIGVPFALPLGIFAFLTEAIPIAGPVIAGVVMIVVALTESPVRGAPDARPRDHHPAGGIARPRPGHPGPADLDLARRRAARRPRRLGDRRHPGRDPRHPAWSPSRCSSSTTSSSRGAACRSARARRRAGCRRPEGARAAPQEGHELASGSARAGARRPVPDPGPTRSGPVPSHFAASTPGRHFSLSTPGDGYLDPARFRVRSSLLVRGDDLGPDGPQFDRLDPVLAIRPRDTLPPTSICEVRCV